MHAVRNGTSGHTSKYLWTNRLRQAWLSRAKLRTMSHIVRNFSRPLRWPRSIQIQTPMGSMHVLGVFSRTLDRPQSLPTLDGFRVPQRHSLRSLDPRYCHILRWCTQRPKAPRVGKHCAICYLIFAPTVAVPGWRTKRVHVPHPPGRIHPTAAPHRGPPSSTLTTLLAGAWVWHGLALCKLRAYPVRAGPIITAWRCCRDGRLQ